MESFLRGEISTSSSRNEPRNNRPARAATPRNERPVPPVIDAEVVSVAPVVNEAPAAVVAVEAPPAVAEHAEAVVPAVAPAEVSAPATGVPAPEVPAQVDPPKPNELNLFEQMLRAIQEMVEGNRREIQDLRGELNARRSRREDTSRIEARLAEEERRSQELLDKLAESEGRLAASQAENRNLSDTVQAQGALLERKEALKFSEEELAELLQYSAIIVFDTCSIMNYPNLLDGVNDGELVVVPKDVNNELEHHKSRFGVDDRKIKAQRAITAIFNYKRRFPLTYAEAMLDLVPAVYRADEGAKEQNDNKILAVALRYKLYAHVPVIFITDDRSLSNKAAGEGLEVWTAKDFLTPPETSFDDEEPGDEIAEATEAPVAEVSEEDQLAAATADAERKAKAQEEFLGQKISAKLLHLEASQISVLQNNGVKTIADFMAQTEASFSCMKAKKGLTFTARFMKEQETIKRKLETL